MIKTKVLILHTSVGNGIKVTAENIFEKLNNSDDYEVRIEDIEKVQSGWLITISEIVYSIMLECISGLWGFLYNSKIILFLLRPLRKPVASFNYKRTLAILREFQPAVVISTEAAPSAVIAYLKSKGLYQGKLVINFSDYHLHSFWLYKEADLYLCSITDQAEKLKKLGVPQEKIAVTGMMIAEKFFKEVKKEEALRKFNLLTSMPVVLLTSGGKARMACRKIFLQLLRSHKSFQVVVVVGNNKKLKSELEKISAPGPHPIKILGYINDLDVLMSAADVMVGKTGGPTMAEAVIKKLPMVITDVRPGHELANLEYLLKNQIVDYGRIPREVSFLVDEILDQKLKKHWDRSFSKIIHPPQGKSLIEALNAILPESNGLKVKNYQET
ncbi:MAG: UDP-N-acetylglucosamine 2-epimerase [bacterium]|nr:UDP-N-acetylglucosamine 2-epimerase [bacterium]